MGAWISSPPRRAKKYGNNTPYYPNNSNTPIGESRSDGFMGFGRGTGMVLNNVKARISKPTLSPPKSLATKHLRNSNRPKRGKNNHGLRPRKL
tara:strand:+ start:183 stop:461 length:279 start_codon:yes stop_codon:yes gene_type:complete